MIAAAGNWKSIPGYRGQRDEGFLIIGIAGIAGLVGARLYHVLESPAEFFANPWPQLLSRYGFAWFGGFLGGFFALIFLARWLRIPVLEFLDIASPAACVGYAIGRIGCLLSGDGDYGMPTSLPWGMSFPNGVVPTDAASTSDAALRIFHLDRRLRRSCGTWERRHCAARKLRAKSSSTI